LGLCTGGEALCDEGGGVAIDELCCGESNVTCIITGFLAIKKFEIK
jgi:hypothetical protein